MSIFERMESNVRGYCRNFPVVFDTARGARITDKNGHSWIDFLAGAGTLNYGHNNPIIKESVLEFIERDNLMHGLDFYTVTKQKFLEAFERHILWPLELTYKMQFTGPTGTNAVEAAIKLARKVTGRTNIVSFTNGFHGASLGSVAATGNSHFRGGAGVPLGNTTFMPYDGYFGDDVDTLDYFRAYLEDGSSGLDLPAAVILETVQGEGGVNVASADWLRDLEELCHQHEILLIVDDIQVGCGRTGSFFSFENAGIVPDIVTLSKSLGAYGLPFSVVLMKSHLDCWKPSEHNGTFRGNNLAFAAATKAIETYWADGEFSRQVKDKGRQIQSRLEAIAERYREILPIDLRGRGMIWGLSCRECPDLAGAVSKDAFERGLIIETSGTDSNVLKLLPPLTIDQETLDEGLEIIEASFEAVFSDEAFLEQHDLVEVNS